MYIGYGYGYGRAKKMGAGYDAVAAAYFAAVPDAFSTARKTIINTLIAGIRSDGNLTKLDRLWLFANTTTGNAVIDVINLQSVTLVNAPGFVADQGYTSNGSTSYINSNYTPSVNGVNFSQNSASYGLYSRTDSAVNLVDMGINQAGNTPSGYMVTKWSDGKTYTNINCAATDQIIANMSRSDGLFSAIRTASNRQAINRNGVEVGFNTNASTTIPTISSFICCYNNNGTASSFSTREISVAYFGSGSINDSTLYSRIQTYMTSLGTQV